MNIFIGPGTYAGDPYLPDEIAKQLVKELQLREGDTVSKNTIVEYLAKHGYGPGWATDVAMVLRNMFGVTPIFYESSGLIDELKLVVEGRETTVEEDITDNDIDMAFSVAVQEAFDEAETEDDQTVIAALSMESLETISDIAVGAQYFSEDQFAQIESVYEAGGKALLEAWCDTLLRPHMVRFMESNVRAQLESVVGMPVETLVEAQSKAEKFRRRQVASQEMQKRGMGTSADPTNGPSGLRQGRAADKARNADPLAKRADSGVSHSDEYLNNKYSAARNAMDKSPSGGFDSFNKGAKSFADKSLRQATDRRVGGVTPMPIPDGKRPARQAPAQAAPAAPAPAAERPLRQRDPNLPPKVKVGGQDPLADRAAGQGNAYDAFLKKKADAARASASGGGFAAFDKAANVYANRGKSPSAPAAAPAPAGDTQKPGMLRRAANAIGKIGGGIKSAMGNGGAPGVAATPSATGPSTVTPPAGTATPGKPSLASRIGHGALNIAKRVGRGVAGAAVSGAAGLAHGVAGGLSDIAHGAARGMKANGITGALGGAALGAVKGAGRAAASTIGHAALGASAGMSGSSNMGSVLKAKLRHKMPGLAYALHGAPDEHEMRASHHLGLAHPSAPAVAPAAPPAAAPAQAAPQKPRPKRQNQQRNPQPNAGFQGPDVARATT